MRCLTIGACLALVLLAGCQEQRTVVVEQSATANMASAVPSGSVYRPASPPVNAPSPCNSPIGTGPYEPLPPRPSMARVVHKPERVMAERRPSCVGMRFRIGPDGVPQDAVVVAEYPSGYGMAAFGEDALSAMRWPPKDDLAWRYLVITLRSDRP